MSNEYAWQLSAPAYYENDIDMEYASRFVYSDWYDVLVSKVGGGTVGRKYDGAWLYRIVRRSDRKVEREGQYDPRQGVTETHENVATLMVARFILSESEKRGE